MKRNDFFRNGMSSLGLLVCLTLSQSSFAREYTIDASHSNVGFSVRHFVTKVKGSFKDFSGDMTFDPEHLEKAKVNAIAQVVSVDTNDKKRDAHLQSDDFFDAKKYPTLTFVSTSVKPNGDKKYKVIGNLTMRGVTKPATFDVEYGGETKDPWGNYRTGFSATTVVNRKDFGINWNKAMDQGGFVVGDDVTIALDLEAIEKKDESKSKKK